MDLWLNDAKQVKAWQDGGSMTGGPKRVVWHSTENDPYKTTARTIADYLNRVGYQVHIVWNPVTGETIQCIPANRAGRGLRNAAGGVQTNREGDVCVQIEVVARAAHPFTQYEMKGLPEIMGWVRGLGVPDVWPGGPPPAAPGTRHVSAKVWTSQAGHYSHSQIPENNHNDPGAIDIKKLFGGGSQGDSEPHRGTHPAWPGRYLTQPPIMRGSDVRTWQKRMHARGWRITVDGAYGPQSEGVCRAFQREKGLTVDGIVGPVTWGAAWTAPVT